MSKVRAVLEFELDEEMKFHLDELRSPDELIAYCENAVGWDEVEIKVELVEGPNDVELESHAASPRTRRKKRKAHPRPAA